MFLNDTEMLAQMLRFADLYHKEGMFCLWFGPAYPVVFVFKPELVEVGQICDVIFSRSSLVQNCAKHIMG